MSKHVLLALVWSMVVGCSTSSSDDSGISKQRVELFCAKSVQHFSFTVEQAGKAMAGLGPSDSLSSEQQRQLGVLDGLHHSIGHAATLCLGGAGEALGAWNDLHLAFITSVGSEPWGQTAAKAKLVEQHFKTHMLQ